ncbi:HlyU family transcriptional regulator [Celerinatantimonas sp. MCCC 1A17872]|uniref:HlyU family transcriptional regulator n=1 Tax=Celerinatantimonas sp. MCCC 1A17872 TaxID=3177514 RepID=UPI0038C44639
MGLFNSLKALLSTPAPTATKQHESVDYQGFSITPEPIAEKGQYRVAGYIRKTVGENACEHRFIRSDVCMSEEQAVELTISKCQVFIDQLGEKIFES